jgi:chromosomal replication initiation ATPase DnaA
MTPQIRTPETWERWGWLVEAVARRHGVPVDALLGPRRYADLSRARKDLYGCLYGSGIGFSEIGRLLGRDHTTVLTGVRSDLRGRR